MNANYYYAHRERSGNRYYLFFLEVGGSYMDVLDCTVLWKFPNKEEWDYC